MLKKSERISSKRHILILNKLPNQYPNFKTEVEIKPLDIYRGPVVEFDDMLRARNSSKWMNFSQKEDTKD